MNLIVTLYFSFLTKGTSISFPNISQTNSSFLKPPIKTPTTTTPSKTTTSTSTTVSNKPFGHIADVEEENEALLESELKTAAQINDEASKNLMSGCGSQSEIVRRDDDEDEEEEMETSTTTTNVSSHHQHSNHIGVIGMSTGVYDDEEISDEASTPPLAASLPHNHHYPNTNYDANSAVAAAFQHLAYLQQIQQQQQQQTYDMASNEDYVDEMKRQNKFSASRGAGSLSYFSDPHLLRSLQVASISSNANLNSHQAAAVASSSSSSAANSHHHHAHSHHIYHPEAAAAVAAIGNYFRSSHHGTPSSSNSSSLSNVPATTLTNSTNTTTNSSTSSGSNGKNSCPCCTSTSRSSNYVNIYF